MANKPSPTSNKPNAGAAGADDYESDDKVAAELTQFHLRRKPSADMLPQSSIAQIELSADAAMHGPTNRAKAHANAINRSLAVVELSINGNILSLNESARQLFGYSDHELLGKNHKVLLDEKYAASEEYSLFRGQLQRAEFLAGEYRYIGKNGRKIWLQASFNPVTDNSGKPQKIVCHAADITQEKINAAGLHGQIAAINRVFIVLEFSPEGVIFAANNNFLQLFGYSLSEIENRHQRMFLSRADRKKPEKNGFWNDLRNGNYKTGRMYYIGKGGKDIWLDATFTPVFDISNTLYKVVMYASDATAQVEAEQQAQIKGAEAHVALAKLRKAKDQLVQAEKLASLGGLVAGISHEVNTPLGIGVTAASHLQAEVSKMADKVNSNLLKRSDLKHFMDSCQESSAVILRNLERAADLIQSFKQVAVDQGSEEVRQFGVKQYLEEIALSLGPALKNTGHTISIECDEKLLLNSFPGAISQVVSNLIMNSLQHAWNDGEAGKISLHATALEQGGIDLTYRDNGRGISSAEQKKVWDPFYTTARNRGGSGLGLSTVFNLLHKPLKGSITLSSIPGEGVKFSLHLPPWDERQ